MLSTQADDVMAEIEAAEKLRKVHLANQKKLVKRFVGNAYRTDMRTNPVPENVFYTYVATVLPTLVFDNPAVTVAAKRVISHEAIARYMEMGLNGWIAEHRVRDVAEQLALDMLFGYGVAKTGLEPRSDYSTGVKSGVGGSFDMDALQPYVERISPAAAIIDADCNTWADARLLGHRFQRDLSDLKDDDRYDQAVVSSLSADDEDRLKDPDEQAAPRSRNKPLRNRVTLYEVYLPEYRQIGTLAAVGGGAGSSAAWIRPLSDYHGPPQGPYTFFGVYLVPDQVYPLSPLAAIAEQERELNAHAAAAAEEAGAAKSLALVDANQAELADNILQAANGTVLKVKGLTKDGVIPLAIGGASEQRLAYLDRLLVRTDRIAGQSEATRGRATGVTATEATLANANGDARTEFIHLKFRESLKRVLYGVGWYLFHDPAVVMPVSSTDPVTGQPFEGLFLGGDQPGQENMDWLMFFLDIEPYSMRRVDPAVQQQRAMMMVELVTNIAPLIPQFPYINWQEILDAVGQANNIPDFARMVLNQMGLQLIQGRPMAGMMPGAMPGGVQGLPPGVNPDVAAAGAGFPAGGQFPRFTQQPAMMAQPAMRPGLPAATPPAAMDASPAPV